MSKDPQGHSSFPEQQLLTENWRKYLQEGKSVNERIGDTFRKIVKPINTMDFDSGTNFRDRLKARNPQQPTETPATATPVDVEEIPDEEPAADTSTAPAQQQFTYFMPDSWYSSADGQTMLKTWKKKYKQLDDSQFKKDMDAFLQVLGPFKSEKLYEDNINKKIQKFANNNYTQSNKQHLVKALSSLPNDHGAISILRSIGNVDSKLVGVAIELFKTMQRR